MSYMFSVSENCPPQILLNVILTQPHKIMELHTHFRIMVEREKERKRYKERGIEGDRGWGIELVYLVNSQVQIHEYSSIIFWATRRTKLDALCPKMNNFWRFLSLTMLLQHLWVCVLSCSTNYYEILHTSRQCNFRDVCEISLWLDWMNCKLEQAYSKFGRISDSIEISVAGRAPAQTVRHTS